MNTISLNIFLVKINVQYSVEVTWAALDWYQQRSSSHIIDKTYAEIAEQSKLLRSICASFSCSQISEVWKPWLKFDSPKYYKDSEMTAYISEILYSILLNAQHANLKQ